MFTKIERLLKRWGWIPMTYEEYKELIPKDSLSYKELVEQVRLMKIGEIRVFKFDPLDKDFSGHPALIASHLCAAADHALAARWEHVPRLGKYLLTVRIFE